MSLQPGVDLAGIVKNNQHLNSLPGEGPRNVIASTETSTAEATEALKGITIATPGRENAARSAMDKDGKKKSSGRAAEQRKMKLQKKHKSKRL